MVDELLPAPAKPLDGRRDRVRGDGIAALQQRQDKIERFYRRGEVGVHVADKACSRRENPPAHRRPLPPLGAADDIHRHPLGPDPADEAHGVVGGLAKGGPAENAGVLPGDVLLEVAGERASSLAELFRKTWRLGSAGVEVPLTLARNADVVRLKVRSADRGDYLRKPALQ